MAGFSCLARKEHSEGKYAHAEIWQKPAHPFQPGSGRNFLQNCPTAHADEARSGQAGTPTERMWLENTGKFTLHAVLQAQALCAY